MLRIIQPSVRRDEQQPIAGVLSLIRELTGPATRADNIADLFVSSFRALDHAIDFDLAAAVMLEQNLDLYVVTRDGAGSLIAPPLIETLRRTLETMIPVSFAAADVIGLNDGVIVPADAFPFGTPLSVIRSAAADRAPLQGTVRVIVVLVDFTDKHMTQTLQHFKDLFFSQGGAQKSVREYYSEVTNGLVDIQGDVVGVEVAEASLERLFEVFPGLGRGSGLAHLRVLRGVVQLGRRPAGHG